MQELYKLDKVAYIRFASVYRSFQDVSDFRDALKEVEAPAQARAQAAPSLARASSPMTAFTDADRAHMARALALAERGLYTTTPNPRVGCVIVKRRRGDRRRLARAGRRAARRGQRARATRERAGDDPRGATLYVTLEPCNHHGRTPPCVDAVHRRRRRRASWRRWAIPIREAARRRGALARRRHRRRRRPARGRGARAQHRLRLAHDARPPVGAHEGRGEPRRPHRARQRREPWITGEAARADGHRWRARACAILTGIGTVLQDDPQLTVRAVATPRQPLRIVIDRHARDAARRRACSPAATRSS